MPTTDEIRRANLDALAREAGSKRKLADTIGVSESQLSQWIHGSLNSATGKPRGLRLATCHRIESAVGKPRGWLDQLHTSEVPGVYLIPAQATTPQPPSLPEALETLGIAIAAVPEALRQELADDMRQWALYGGRDKHREAVAESLMRSNGPSQQTTGT